MNIVLRGFLLVLKVEYFNAEYPSMLEELFERKRDPACGASQRLRAVTKALKEARALSFNSLISPP
jgi:hypothetical protein